MVEPKSYIEIAYSSIKCFAHDGSLDTGELNYLLGLAMRDGVIDVDEKRVLKNILSKVNQADVASWVWDRIQEVKHRHGLN